MAAPNYEREISTTASVKDAYDALTTGFDKWWTPGSVPVTAVGDVVTFRFEPTYWTMRVTELVPVELVAFECIEAFHKYEGSPDSILREWQGTKLSWHIQRHGNKTKISFVHEGLVPSLNCYGICERGWDHFFSVGLKKYLDTIAINSENLNDR